MKWCVYVITFISVGFSAYCGIKTDKEMTNDLTRAISPNPFFIPADRVKEITECYDLEVERLLQMLIPIAQSYARPFISNYKVGVAALGKSGNIYLGVNLEFLGVPLNAVIHGEQFAMTNARGHGETELISIALSAAPCGHCRQFLNEMAGSDNLQILVPGCEGTSLSSLLPKSFGPKDLGLQGGLLATLEDTFSYDELDCPLSVKATEAAFASYAPYSESKSGIAIRTKEGKIYTGSYLENVAFNPSISPLQAALILLVVDGKEYCEISEVTLAEKQSSKISQEALSRELLRNIAPEAVFNIKKLEHL